MWFRNLQIYQLTETFNASAEELHEILLDKAFKPCQGLDKFRIGWAYPLGKHGNQLVHATNGCLMLCMRREDRILPASVVRDAVDEKVDEIEAKDARTVGRKEKNDIKDEVIVDLLPRAFTKSSRSYAYIDPRNNRVILNCTTSNKAEEILTLIRDTLGSFKVKPLAVNSAPSVIMTGWVKNLAPADVEISDECELKEPVENGGVIRIRGVDLGSDEVQQHLNSGKIVSKLAIEWQQRISCVLAEDLSIKRLKFMDLVMEEASDTAADDEVMRFDADFALMSLELSRFIPVLCEYLGGVDNS
ncbi:MAG: recombination-associated protein RdgC [Gammaproteobacteria bacterium]|nr:recombination-associated protein RdgC [Gammaproteobacteria bacterium]